MMKAAFYESDITPPLGCYMTGYGRDRRALEVYDKLYSKALIIEENGNYAVIISVDICEYPDEMHDLVTQRIFEYTGIKPECVCISSTHAHCGAPVTDNPNINCFGDSQYKDVFFRLVADSAVLAFKRLGECSFSFTKTKVEAVSYNRCHYMKDGTIANLFTYDEQSELPFTEPDRELTVIFAESGGKKIGALYNFCCHQDSVNEKENGYSGDYSSEISKRLKAKYGSDFISIYVPGPAGDINHINTENPERLSLHYREIGKVLAQAIVSCQDDTARISGKLQVTKEKINIKKRKYTQEQYEALLKFYLDTKQGNFAYNNLTYYRASEKDDSKELYVQVIAIGDLAMFIYPGEIFVEYSHRTKRNSPFKHTMVIQHSNAFGGYIPTPEAFAPNSRLYEIRPSYCCFLVPEAGEILYEKAIEMGKQMKGEILK